MNFICAENYRQHPAETYFLVFFLLFNPAVETTLYICLSLLGFGLLDTNHHYTKFLIKQGEWCPLSYRVSLYCSLSGHISSSFTVTALSLTLQQNIFHALLDIVNSTLSTNPGLFLFSVNRYNLPVGKQGGSCMIEISADNGTAQRLEENVSHPMSEVTAPACC